VAAAETLLRHEQYRSTIDFIKNLPPQLWSPRESHDMAVLLAAAYMGDGNAFWAIRTLGPRVDAEPGDCELRVWLAWAYFHMAELERAREVLDHPSCRASGPEAARASLMRAMMAKTEGTDESAADDLARAWAATEMFPADREALSALTQRIEPDGIAEQSWKFEARQGFSSNALLGSPTDPNASQSISDTTSGYYQLSGWFRISPNLHRRLRPALEVEARTFQLDNPDLSALSYVILTGRLGTFVGSHLPRLFVAWRPEYLHLAGGALAGTGPNWYAGAHRAEAELEITPWLMAFAGGGRRDFRPMIRDRYELDGGLGGHVPIVEHLSMVWAVSGRKHWTDHGTYDLWGGTGLVNMLYTFERGFEPRAGVTLAGDTYPRWNGYLDSADSTENRRDLFVKTTAALWSPPAAGFRFGVMYEYSHRNSSARLFEFSDHRASVLLTWSGSADWSRPKLARSAPLATIPWGLGAVDGRLKERVQDFLREDERTLQRSCGCRE
jgi:hypothetical protein